MYFIIGFGIRYGPETAELWLIQFCFFVLTTFIICDPLVIFVKCAIIPTAVHKFVLSHPDLLSIGTASAGAPAFMGASIGILGATGQAAIALGMGAAAIGGAAGAAASRWRKKRLLKNHENGFNASNDTYEKHNLTALDVSPDTRKKSREYISKYSVLSREDTIINPRRKEVEKRLTPLLERTIFEIVMKLFVTNGSHGKAHQTHMLNDKETNMLKSDIVESLGGISRTWISFLSFLNEDLLRTIQNSLPRVLRKNIMNKEEMSSIKKES